MGIVKKLKKKIYENHIQSKYAKYIIEEKIDLDWGSINCNRIALINAAITKVMKLKNHCKYLEIYKSLPIIKADKGFDYILSE